MEQENTIILVDGFEDAFEGILEGFGGQRACYSLRKVIDILMNMNMSYEEALEYYEYNILGAFYKDNMPLFLENMSLNDLYETQENTSE